MEELLKKLKEVQELTKSLNIPPSPKPPKPPKPGNPEAVKKPEAPKAGASLSNKDPKKMAEQLKEPDLKDQAMKEAKELKEGIRFNKSGQWKLE